MTGIIAVNGEFFDSTQARIPALDRGFLFGDSIFETFVAFNKTILNTTEHLERLRQSGEKIGLHIPYSNEQLLFEITHAIDLVPAKKLAIRLVITRGSSPGFSTSSSMQPNRMIYCLPATSTAEHYYRDGIRLQQRKLPFTEQGPIAKTSNYLRSIVAIEHARKKSFDDILWENSNGEITESSIANIFFIGRQGDLVDIHTPPTTSGILAGITRATILTLLKRAKIKAEEHIVYSSEIPRFDEAFLCSTVRGLVPISSISEQKMHTTRPSAIFWHINRLYMAWVTGEVGEQIDWNTGNTSTS